MPATGKGNIGMAILKQHLSYYEDIFGIPGFLAEPFLTIGLQDILGTGFPKEFEVPTLNEVLQSRGLSRIETLDLFDDRATIRHDLNTAVPAEWHERYKTVFDIGSIEHVMDARQCLENCLRMIAVGGCYGLVTPIHGYYGHGLRAFHHSYFEETLTANGFEVVYRKFSAYDGQEVADPRDAQNTLIWLVARKARRLEKFEIPQEGRWEPYYENKEFETVPRQRKGTEFGKAAGRKLVRLFLQPLWRMLWRWRRKIIKALDITEF